MASTPSNRLKLTPSNSPYLPHPARSLYRSRVSAEPRLSLKRIVGTTCASPTGFDTVNSLFAYIAGGAVVVVDVDGATYTQRFYRARPTALPIYSIPPHPHSPSTPTQTPKANDSRNRVSLRESTCASLDWAESSTSSSKTWTSRERIKAATCLALSKEGRFLAVGETGYAPRVLIFNLEDNSSDTPLVSISEHGFGVKAVAWSPDSKYLASLGSANDGFLYIWKIDTKTGAAKLFQQNRCTSYIRGMIWVGNNLITLGVRHIKVWRVEEGQSISPVKQKFIGEPNAVPQPHQKTLSGRNVLLGNMIDATFSCAAAIDDTKAIICSETGDICLFDDADKQMKLTNVLESGFATTCVAIRENVVYLGGKSGDLATLDLTSFVECSPDCLRTSVGSFAGLFAMGFLEDNLVTVDAKRTIHVWEFDHGPEKLDLKSPIPISGHQDSVLGVDSLKRPNAPSADFYSWSGSGQVILWDVDGEIKSSFQVPLDEPYSEDEPDLLNQLTLVRATEGGKFFVTGDKLGVVKIIDFSTQKCVASMKAHASDCQFITTYEDKSKFVIATCGRDRTAQLFYKTTSGEFEHFQTLEFAARVVQVLIPSADRVITCSLDRNLQIHDLVTKDGEPDAMAAIPSKTLPLKASPSSMTTSSDGKSLFVSLQDRSVSMFDLESGKLTNAFKCTDESGIDSVILDSLTARSATEKEPAILLGVSNTDKSIRIYDAQTGSFLDREWGHTEAINGLALIESNDSKRNIVSVGSDGTMMIWEMDLQDPSWGATTRDPSPIKDSSTLSRPTLRRVLSKAELAEFQRPSPSTGRRSPPRTITKRRSIFNLSATSSSSSSKTPVPPLQTGPALSVVEDTPSRRPSADSRCASPPASPKARIKRRPSLPALNSAKTKSNNNLRGFGSLTMATEQACRTLRAYRKKLSSTDPISQDVLAELDQELRLTAVALGDRATRSKAMSDTMLTGLLDQYSERLVAMLDEKLRLSYPAILFREPDSPGKRPSTAGSAAASATSATSATSSSATT
ncbi:WD domain-containing protein [Annulohypoxylon bovei var. microspora]|nr:WD domain-containing protein [Annulohypoxylon bovei var. microspora]